MKFFFDFSFPIYLFSTDDWVLILKSLFGSKMLSPEFYFIFFLYHIFRLNEIYSIFSKDFWWLILMSRSFSIVSSKYILVWKDLLFGHILNEIKFKGLTSLHYWIIALLLCKRIILCGLMYATKLHSSSFSKLSSFKFLLELF